MRHSLPFVLVSLLTVACTQGIDGQSEEKNGTSSADSVSAKGSPTPKCAEEPSVAGVTLFRDAHRSSVFYALPDTWSIDPIVARTPVLEDTNHQPWVEASQKLSPMLGSYEVTLRLSASTKVPLAALRDQLMKDHPELEDLDVQPLPLEMAGDPKLSFSNVDEKDPAVATIAQSGVTTLEVKVNHETFQGNNDFLSFVSRKVAPFVLDVPVSFACTGELSSRTLHLNAGASRLAFTGKGITVTNEDSALSLAVSVVNAAEVLLSSSGAAGEPYTEASMKALHDGLDASLRPVLTASALALHTSDLTTKASTDATSAIEAFHRANPESDVTSLLERANRLGQYQFNAGIEPFGN